MVYCMLGWMHDLVEAVCNECMQQLVDVSLCTTVRTLCSNCRLFMHSPVRIQLFIGMCPKKSNPPCSHAYGINLIHKHTILYTHYCKYDILNCSGIFLPPASPSFLPLSPSLPLLSYSSWPISQFPSHLSLPPLCPSNVLPTVLSTLLHITLPYLPPFFLTLPLFPLSPSPCCLPPLPYVCGTESFAIHRAHDAKDLSAAHNIPTPDCDLYAQVVDALAWAAQLVWIKY